MNGGDRDRNDAVVSAVLTASRALVAVSARSLSEVEDRLTMTQFRTLVVLSEAEQTNVNRLADSLGVAASTAVRTLDRLTAADLVTREENTANRREVVVSLTSQGRKVVEAVTDRRRLEISRIIARMTASPTDQLVEAFRVFAAAAGETSTPGHPPSVLGW